MLNKYLLNEWIWHLLWRICCVHNIWLPVLENRYWWPSVEFTNRNARLWNVDLCCVSCFLLLWLSQQQQLRNCFRLYHLSYFQGILQSCRFWFSLLQECHQTPCFLLIRPLSSKNIGIVKTISSHRPTMIKINKLGKIMFYQDFCHVPIKVKTINTVRLSVPLHSS